MPMQPAVPSQARASVASVEKVAELLRVAGAMNRATIGARTGLSRPSVSGAVTTLVADGRAEEIETPAVGRGRPSRQVRISRRRVDVVGIEIGRRHVAVAGVNATGEVVAAETVLADPNRTLAERTSVALDLLDDVAVRRQLDLSRLGRAAVGTPGPRFSTAFRAGNGAGADSLSRSERDRALVAELVGRRLEVRVDTGNNTRYTALARSHTRADDLGEDLVYLRVDEGVGGGIVLNGRLVAGAWGAAGEFGHISIDPLGAGCPCGGRGCLELTAALPAVVRASGAADETDLREHAERPGYASAILAAATATGGVLAGVLAATNPRLVVIGGAVAELPGFLDRVDQVARAAAPAWAVLDLVIEPASTDHLLGAIGAAVAAWVERERLTHDPL